MTKIFKFFMILTLTNTLILHNGFSATAESQALTTAATLKLDDLDKELRLQTEFFNLMLQVGKDIDSDPKIDNGIFNNTDQMAALIQNKIKIYQSFYEEALQIPSEKKSLFRKYFLSLDWKTISTIFKQTHIGAERFLKKKGVGVGIAIMLGFVCEYVFPVILMNIGLPQLLPITFVTPWAVIYSFVPGSIQKLKIRKMQIEALGGKVEYLAFQKQREMVMGALHMHSPDDLIFPLQEVEGMAKGMVIPKVSWEVRFMEMLGLKKKSFGYNSVFKFLSENSLSDPYITWLIENKKISKEMKAAYITGHLLSLNNPDISDKIYTTFSENIITLKNNSNWSELWDWTEEMKKVSNMDELFLKIEKTPSSIHPKELVIIWENILLPEYAVNLNLNYFEGRRLFDQFEVIKAKLQTSGSSELDLASKNELYAYFRKVLDGRSFKGCYKDPRQINEILLRAL